MNVAADQAEAIAKRRGELRKEAQDLLRKQGGDPQELLDRAEDLKEVNEFGYARRLVGRAREQPTMDPELCRRLRHRHALCTYKDADLPVYEKLRRALDILGSGEEDLRSTSDQETLGLAGAIHKRLWQVDGNKGHLEQSLAYYLRGYEAGVEKDHGYTAINAAHVLDQLASLEEERARVTGRDSQLVQERRNLARVIRETVVSTLRRLAEAETSLEEQWWFQVTVAEAHFGLQQYDLAAESLRRARRIPDVPRWEFESTAVQLAATARLQARDVPENEEETRAWQVLEEFLDGRADAVRSVFAGKLGIALSGGGFRASFFHIGVLAKLAELDLL
ncbi:MAG: patatin family protein, partial [Acidobacteria bacterium]|nr:patatin family protein [Acidobacteriota bacterium]